MENNESKPSYKRLYSPKEAAEYLGYSVPCLALWRSRGIGPAYIRTGTHDKPSVRYHVDDLETWIEAHRVRPVELPEDLQALMDCLGIDGQAIMEEADMQEAQG